MWSYDIIYEGVLFYFQNPGDFTFEVGHGFLCYSIKTLWHGHALLLKWQCRKNPLDKHDLGKNKATLSLFHGYWEGFALVAMSHGYHREFCLRSHESWLPQGIFPS